MTTSRDDILTKIRARSWDGLPLPSLDQEWTRYADPRQQFAEVLASVGGRCVAVASAAVTAAAAAEPSQCNLFPANWLRRF